MGFTKVSIKPKLFETFPEYLETHLGKGFVMKDENIENIEHFEKRQKDSGIRKIVAGTMDGRTIDSLLRLSKKLRIEKIHGFVKEGKESSVLAGELKDGREIAIKIFAVDASNFKRMQPYIEGDKRFKKIKPTKHGVITAWCKKEYKNLMLARAAGVKCPEPFGFRDNILVMEFIGGKQKPGSRLQDVRFESQEDAESIINTLIDYVTKLHNAGLVHGDLSPYNILLYDGEPWIIDFSQGVLKDHPLAKELAERDLKCILEYARKLGVKVDEDKIKPLR